MSTLAKLWPRVDTDADPLLHATPARVARRRRTSATQQPQGHVPVGLRGLQQPQSIRPLRGRAMDAVPCRARSRSRACTPLPLNPS